MLLADVAQKVLGLDKMVAGVEIAVVLQGESMPAGGIEDAHAGGGQAQPVSHGRLKGLDEYPAHIIADPFVKNGAQEITELFGPHRTLRNGGPFLVKGDSLFIEALDRRDELHPGGAGFVPEKAVNLEGVISVEPINGGENIVFHPMLLQQPEASQHPVKGWPAPLVHPVGIVQLAGTVDANADEEAVLAEELAPFVVQERAVGLQGVLEGHVRPLVLVLVSKGAPIKVETHQGGFPPCQATVTVSARWDSMSCRI